jgi:hypothetical protein
MSVVVTPTRIARQALFECPVTRSLLISGTFLPPSEEALHFYQALYYETHWWVWHTDRVPCSDEGGGDKV